MASEGVLETASQRISMNSRDSRLGAGVECRGTHAGSDCSRLAELSNISTCNEILTGPHQHDHRDSQVGVRMGNGVNDAPSHLGSQGVDGRIVDCDYGHNAFDFVTDHQAFAHLIFLSQKK
ncbi:hypothetical protein D3C84_514140 [compost metagenome]